MTRARGFTLIELLASMALMATAFGLFTLSELTARRITLGQATRLELERQAGEIARPMRADLRAALKCEPGEPVTVLPTDAEIKSGARRVAAILEVAGQSSAGDPVAGVRDRVVYELIADKRGCWQLWRAVEAAEGSARTPDRRLLASRLIALTLTETGGVASAHFQLLPPQAATSGAKARPHTLSVVRRPALSGGAR